MDYNQLALLELLKASLFGTEPSFQENVDWIKVLEEAKAHTVVALAAKAIPKEHVALWEEASLHSQARFLQVLYTQKQLVLLFEQVDIPLVILKGTAAAMYYPEPRLRAMGDVDFLVPQDRFVEAQRLIMENGYSPLLHSSESVGDEIPRHVEFEKGNVIFELHHHFSSYDLEIESALISGLRNTETQTLYGVRFPRLPDKENGLVLLAHACQHLQNGQLGLRQIIDWMMLVHSYLDDERWSQEFQPFVAQYGLEKAAVTMTYLCRRWLGLPDQIKWCESADEQQAYEMLELILCNGNFGRKAKSNKVVEGLGMAVAEKGFFRVLQETGLRTWTVAQKYEYLRPFAWIYQLFRWAIRGARFLLHPYILYLGITRARRQSEFNGNFRKH